LTSCAESSLDGHASIGQAIVGGEDSPSGGIEDAVVLLRSEVKGGELVCTAALVASNLALTARHCVSYSSPGAFRCNTRGELIDSVDGGGSLGLDLPANAVTFYGTAQPRDQPIARGARIVSTLSDTSCVNDLAFVVLDRKLDLPVLPLRLGRPARASEPVTLVGYGTSQFGEMLEWRTQTRQRKSGLVIAGVGPDLADQVTTIPPRTIIVDGPSGCLGDSGGPLMAEATHALLGVFALSQGSDCADPKRHNLFVHVPSFDALTHEAFAAAGASPVLEPEDEPEPTDAGDESELADATGEIPSMDADADALATPPAEPPSEDPASGGCGITRSKPGVLPGALLGLFVLAVRGTLRVRRRTG
jgi:hypothetical protein